MNSQSPEYRREYYKKWRAKEANRAKMRDYSRKYYKDNKDYVNGKSKEYRTLNSNVISEKSRIRYQKNKELYSARSRKNYIERTYGITLEQYDVILKKQNGKCAICRSDNPGGNGSFHVDHDHIKNNIRGLLCYGCNVSLGRFDDNIKLLKRAIEYLENSK